MNTMTIFVVSEAYEAPCAYFTTLAKAEAYVADKVAEAFARYVANFGDDGHFNPNILDIDEVEVM